MTSSLIPTVEETNPTAQNAFRQDSFLIQGKRPLNRHTPSSSILVPDPAQKLNPSINVELVGG
jgi:hypothetical protein